MIFLSLIWKPAAGGIKATVKVTFRFIRLSSALSFRVLTQWIELKRSSGTLITTLACCRGPLRVPSMCNKECRRNALIYVESCVCVCVCVWLALLNLWAMCIIWGNAVIVGEASFCVKPYNCRTLYSQIKNLCWNFSCQGERIFLSSIVTGNNILCSFVKICVGVTFLCKHELK